MALTQTQAKAPGTGGRAQFVGPVLAAAAVIVVIGLAGAFGSSLTARQGGTVLTTRGDPLVESGAIQFRAAEHAAGLTLADPFVGPGAIEFRANEHAATTSGAAFIAQLRAIQYRLRLLAASLVQPDPLLRPDAIQFRASEHAAGLQDGRAYDWYPTREHAAGLSAGAGVTAGEHPAGVTAGDWYPTRERGK
jgi:hypothetical protein